MHISWINKWDLLLKLYLHSLISCSTEFFFKLFISFVHEYWQKALKNVWNTDEFQDMVRCKYWYCISFATEQFTWHIRFLAHSHVHASVCKSQGFRSMVDNWILNPWASHTCLKAAKWCDSNTACLRFVSNWLLRLFDYLCRWQLIEYNGIPLRRKQNLFIPSHL